MAAKHDQTLHFWLPVFFSPSCSLLLWCSPIFSRSFQDPWQSKTKRWDSIFILGLFYGCDALIKYSSCRGVERLRFSSLLYSLGYMGTSKRSCSLLDLSHALKCTLLYCSELLSSQNTTQQTNRPTCKTDVKPSGPLLVHIRVASPTCRKERKSAQMGTSFISPLGAKVHCPLNSDGTKNQPLRLGSLVSLSIKPRALV